MRRVLQVALAGMAVGAVLAGFAIAPATAQSLPPRINGVFIYSATTEAPALHQGQAPAGGMTWTCVDRTCLAGSPSPTPTAQDCAALKALVGRITAYGLQGSSMGETDLARCNGDARKQATFISLTPPITQLPPTPVTPVSTAALDAPMGAELTPMAAAMPVPMIAPAVEIVAEPVAPPPIAPVAAAPPAPRSVVAAIIAVPELTFIGAKVEAAVEPGPIRVGELSFVGGGMVMYGRDPAAVAPEASDVSIVAR